MYTTPSLPTMLLHTIWFPGYRFWDFTISFLHINMHIFTYESARIHTSYTESLASCSYLVCQAGSFCLTCSILLGIVAVCCSSFQLCLSKLAASLHAIAGFSTWRRSPNVKISFAQYRKKLLKLYISAAGKLKSSSWRKTLWAPTQQQLVFSCIETVVLGEVGVGEKKQVRSARLPHTSLHHHLLKSSILCSPKSSAGFSRTSALHKFKFNQFNPCLTLTWVPEYAACFGDLLQSNLGSTQTLEREKDMVCSLSHKRLLLASWLPLTTSMNCCSEHSYVMLCVQKSHKRRFPRWKELRRDAVQKSEASGHNPFLSWAI